MKRKLSLVLALMLVLSLLIVGCGKEPEKPADSKDNTEAEKPEEKPEVDNPAKGRENADDTIIFSATEAKGDFMPVYRDTAYDGYVNDWIFDPLIVNDEEGNLVPHVAKEWELSEDKKTYTFHLRDDVKFSDGKPLTAEDVKFTFEILSDPKYDSRHFGQVMFLEGYEEYNEGDAEEVTGIKVIDDHTVSFTFTDAKVTHLLDCKMGIMPKHYYNYKKGDLDTLKEQMSKPMGSGPYVMTNYEEKQFIEFEANEDYFLGGPKIPNMIYKFGTPETQIQEIEKGDVDVVIGATTTPENKEIIDGTGFLTINAFPNNGYCYLGWDLTDPKFEDKKVRQALTYGFNRQQFIDTFFAGHGDVCHVPISQASWAFTDGLKEGLNKYEYDPEKAKELLDEAGWKEGSDGVREKDGEKLEVTFTTFVDTEWIERIIPMLKEDWEAIGVKLEPDLQEFNAVVDKVNKQRDFDMFSLCWGLDVDPDASGTFHSRETVEGGTNNIMFKNDKNDELLDTGVEEFDQEKRKEIYEEWGLLMNEELPYMYIYIRENWDVVNDRVKNINTSPFIDPAHPSVIINMELEK